MNTTSLAPLLERFFTQRLDACSAKPVRIPSVPIGTRFRQFLSIFAQQRLQQPPSRLDVEQIDAPVDRGVSR